MKDTLKIVSCFFFLFSIISWNLPVNSSLRRSITTYTEKYMYGLGLYQSWGMFADNQDLIPNTYLFRVRTFIDGEGKIDPQLNVGRATYRRSVIRSVLQTSFNNTNQDYLQSLLTYECSKKFENGNPQSVVAELAIIPNYNINKVPEGNSLEKSVQNANYIPYASRICSR